MLSELIHRFPMKIAVDRRPLCKEKTAFIKLIYKAVKSKAITKE